MANVNQFFIGFGLFGFLHSHVAFGFQPTPSDICRLALAVASFEGSNESRILNADELSSAQVAEAEGASIRLNVKDDSILDEWMQHLAYGFDGLAPIVPLGGYRQTPDGNMHFSPASGQYQQGVVRGETFAAYIMQRAGLSSGLSWISKWRLDPKSKVANSAELMKMIANVVMMPSDPTVVSRVLNFYKEAYDPTFDLALHSSSILREAHVAYPGSASFQFAGFSRPRSLGVLSPKAAAAFALGYAKVDRDEIAKVLLYDLRSLSSKVEPSDTGELMSRIIAIKNSQGDEGYGAGNLFANPVITSLGRLQSKKSFDALDYLFSGLGHYATEFHDDSQGPRYAKYFSMPDPSVLLAAMYSIDPDRTYGSLVKKFHEVESIHRYAVDNEKMKETSHSSAYGWRANVWRYHYWPDSLWRACVDSDSGPGILSSAHQQELHEEFGAIEAILIAKNHRDFIK